MFLNTLYLITECSQIILITITEELLFMLTHWIKERYVVAMSSDWQTSLVSVHWSELSANNYRVVKSISKRRPGPVLWMNVAVKVLPGPADVGCHPLTYALLPRNFALKYCVQFPDMLPFGNFLSWNGKFFSNPGNRVPLTTPKRSLNLIRILAVEVWI